MRANFVYAGLESDPLRERIGATAMANPEFKPQSSAVGYVKNYQEVCMNLMKQILIILVCLAPYAPRVVAQEPQPVTPPRDSREVAIIIQQQQLRFTAPASTQEIRLEV